MPAPLVITAAATALGRSAFWTAIWSFIISIAAPLLMYALKALGLGFVVYTGLTLVFDQAEAFIFSYYDNLPVNLYKMLTIAGVDIGIKMIFAAAAANIVLRNGSSIVRRIQPWKRPGSPWEA